MLGLSQFPLSQVLNELLICIVYLSGIYREKNARLAGPGKKYDNTWDLFGGQYFKHCSANMFQACLRKIRAEKKK